MENIHTSAAPAAIGPYSQAVKAASMLFVSGQLPVDPKTGLVSGDTIQPQAEQSCRNVGEVLKAGGAGFEQVVKTTCFLNDMADFPVFNAVYEKYFVSKPARACVAVRELPRGVLCEIEAIAVI